MLKKYKEIFFGLAFGIVANVLDTGVDALSNGNSLGDEVVERPAVMLYRAVFILLGLAFGWLLWKANRRERQYRQLTETLGRIQRECEQHTLL